MTRPTLSKLNASLKMTITSLFVTSLLAGCGIQGSLKTPPPVFGGDTKVNPERVPTDDLDKNSDDDSEEYGVLNDDLGTNQ